MISDYNAVLVEKKNLEIAKLADNKDVATNYTIRETENIREIQVLVQAGHLKDVIEQDFLKNN